MTIIIIASESVSVHFHKFSSEQLITVGTVHSYTAVHQWWIRSMEILPSLFFARALAEARDHLCNLEPVWSTPELGTRFCMYKYQINSVQQFHLISINNYFAYKVDTLQPRYNAHSWGPSKISIITKRALQWNAPSEWHETHTCSNGLV